MTLTRSALIAGIAGLALLLAGCASTNESPVGTWGEEDGPTLTLAEDGTLSGSDGCNRLTGGWTQSEGQIDFGEVASTMMACEDIDTWLNGLATGTIKGSTLHILNASGTEIGTLERDQ